MLETSNSCHAWLVMSGVLLWTIQGKKGWGALPNTYLSILHWLSKRCSCCQLIFRPIFWLAHTASLKIVISEENDWMKLQVFKIAIFKCRRLNLTNLSESLNGILTVNIRFSVFSLISQFVRVMTKTPCLWRKDPDQWNITLLLPVRNELRWQN